MRASTNNDSYRYGSAHPSEFELTRHAIDDCSANDGTSPTSLHVNACNQCSDVVDAIRAVAASVERAPTPVASDAMLARILTERAKGTRVILADGALSAPSNVAAHGDDVIRRAIGVALDGVDDDAEYEGPWHMSEVATRAAAQCADKTAMRLEERGRVRQRWIGTLAATAATVAIATVWPVVRAHGEMRDAARRVVQQVSAVDATRDDNEFMELVSPWPRVAHAQRGPMPPEASIVRGLDGNSLRPGAWSSLQFTTSDGTSHSQRVTVSSVDRTRLAGREVMRLVTTRTIKAIDCSDTLWLDAVDLRPVRWTRHTARRDFVFDFAKASRGRARMIRTFTHPTTAAREVDTLLLAVNASGVILADDSQLNLLFRLVSLRPGSKFSVGVPRPLGAGIPDSPMVMSVEVVGEVTASTRWGRVAAWRVRVGGQQNRELLVGKSTGDIVQQTLTFPNGAKTVTELLTSP